MLVSGSFESHSSRIYVCGIPISLQSSYISFLCKFSTEISIGYAMARKVSGSVGFCLIQVAFMSSSAFPYRYYSPATSRLSCKFSTEISMLRCFTQSYQSFLYNINSCQGCILIYLTISRSTLQRLKIFLQAMRPHILI